jgi:DNA gyrase subunit B
VALDGAVVLPDGAATASRADHGERAGSAGAQAYVLATSVIERLSNWMDLDALRAMANGLTLDLDTRPPPKPAPLALQAGAGRRQVEAQFDARTDKHLLRISRRHHGNIKASVITQDFLHGADYAALKEAGLTFKGLLGPDALVRRGEGERMKEQKVTDFRAAMAWLMLQAEERRGPPALQGPGRDEPRAAVGNHDGPHRAPPAARADRRRHRGRPRVHDADGRRGGAASGLHREQCVAGGEYRRVSRVRRRAADGTVRILFLAEGRA